MSSRRLAFILEPADTASHEILKEVAEVKLGHADRRYSDEELMREAEDADALLITSRDGVSRAVMQHCLKLKAIVKYGAKPHNVDLQAATELGIAVSWTPGSNAVSVAEHTLAMILALTKRLVASMNGQKEGKWRNVMAPTVELDGKTAGIVGLGQVGRELCTRLSAFGVMLLGYDPYSSPETAQQLHVRMVELDCLLEDADIVSLNCELNAETHHMIGEPQLSKMRPGAFLVNTARGGLVNTNALYGALKAGSIAGAGLDVFEEEPTKADTPLFLLPNVIHTPHMAGVSYEAMEREPVWAAEEAVRILKGAGGHDVLNPDYVKNARVE